MKVGILTFNAAINYGAVLQTFGLMKVLERMGHEIHVIDYNPSYFRFYYNFKHDRPGLRSLLTASGWTIWIDYFAGFKRKPQRVKEFISFSNQYLNIDFDPIEDIPSRYDVIICGSDQIWNPIITGGKFDDTFFGFPYCSNGLKVISYAASAGSPTHLKGFENEFKSKLLNFSAISVREQNLADFINQIDSDFSAKVVVDPTILAGADTFENITSDRLIKKKYLFYFDIFNDSLCRNKAIKLAKERNLKFVELSTYHEYVSGIKLHPPGSPADFCSLVKYAECIVTTSFHATAFALLFHKDFFCLEFNPAKGERITNILDQLGLSERFIKREQEIHNSISSPLNWNAIDTRIQELRESSLDFLRSALS